MEVLLKLSPAQSLLQRTAARHTDRRAMPPDTLRGGARVFAVCVGFPEPALRPGWAYLQVKPPGIDEPGAFLVGWTD